MAESTREDRIRLSDQARQVRTSPAFLTAIEVKKAEGLNQSLLEKTVEMRERARAMVLALIEITTALDDLVTDGEQAAFGNKVRETK
jgi:hypothetical protein